ncbi:hypothetical protein FOZ60_005221 [Perkinsus olseni]|nr:hypothetical protein FOZ60_005221 [Perkinsus olseni]
MDSGGGLYSRTPFTSSSSSRTTQDSSATAYYHYSNAVKPSLSNTPMLPGSPDGNGSSSIHGDGRYSDSGGGGSDSDRRTSRPSSEGRSGGRPAHYEGFGYQPQHSGQYYYDEGPRESSHGYPLRAEPGYPNHYYYDTPLDRGRPYHSPPPRQRPLDFGMYDRQMPIPFPGYRAPVAAGAFYGMGRESDGLEEIERAAERRMQAYAAAVAPTQRPQHRLPGNASMLKMFRVYLEKQGDDSKLGAVLVQKSLPAVSDDEYGAGLRVKTVMEAEEIGEIGMLARWNGRAREMDRDIRVGDVIVAVVDGTPVDTLGPKASPDKLMDKLKVVTAESSAWFILQLQHCLKCNSLTILDVLREVPPLEACDWPQTQQTMVNCLESMEQNLEQRRDQAMTWFVGNVAPVILSPSSQLW